MGSNNSSYKYSQPEFKELILTQDFETIKSYIQSKNINYYSYVDICRILLRDTNISYDLFVNCMENIKLPKDQISGDHTLLWYIKHNIFNMVFDLTGNQKSRYCYKFFDLNQLTEHLNNTIKYWRNPNLNCECILEVAISKKYNNLIEICVKLLKQNNQCLKKFYPQISSNIPAINIFLKYDPLYIIGDHLNEEQMNIYMSKNGKNYNVVNVPNIPHSTKIIASASTNIHTESPEGYPEEGS